MNLIRKGIGKKQQANNVILLKKLSMCKCLFFYFLLEQISKI